MLGSKRLTVPLLALVGLTSACTAENLDYRPPVDGAPMQSDSPTGQAMLRLVNHPSTTYDVLDRLVGLDHRAARRIVVKRNGLDGRCGTADDQPFRDLAALDQVSYVGDAALNRLADYAHAHGWVMADDQPAGTYLEVNFTAGEARDVLDIVNRADAETLEVVVGLSPDVVDAILDVRPFASLNEVALLSEVDQASLKALRGW